MSRFSTSFVVCMIVICWAARATASTDITWRNQFRSKINVLPEPSRHCYVCFYEKKNFAGQSFCMGKRPRGCKAANPIVTPGTIGSIKFGQGCDLVVNARVSDVPFSEHMAVFSTDIRNTGFDVSSSHSVSQVYVEEAGHACFLGIPTSIRGFGVCYNDSVPVVQDEYQNTITELLLFKTDMINFDVIVYESEYYNNPGMVVMQSDVETTPLKSRFSGYSKLLETNVIDRKSGMKKNLQDKVRSIKFVAPVVNSDATPGVVIPASYGV